MGNYRRILFFISPVVLSLLLHLQIFKLDVLGIHVWRQSQTQTVIYNFTFLDNDIHHPQRFDLSSGNTALLYEFPLYQWTVAQINRAFGYSVLNTRLFTFLVFVFLLLGFYKWMRCYFKEELALLSSYFLCFSPLLYYYCINPLPDTMALCFSLWFLFFATRFANQHKWTDYLFAIIFLALAALVKLPFVLFGFIMVPSLIKLGLSKRTIFQSAVTILFMLPVVVWYSNAIPTWSQNGIVHGLFANQKSWIELLDYFWFHLVSTFPELISNYAAFPLVLLGLYFIFKNKQQLFKKHLSLLLGFTAISFYFLFELNMIEKSHDYYLMPLAPFVFLLLALGANQLLKSKIRMILYLLIVLAPILAYLRIQHRWDKIEPGFNAAYLYEQKQIQNLLPKSSICVVDYDDSKFIALYYLKRFGYSLYENEINPIKLESLIEKGASHLVTENKNFNKTIYANIYFHQIYSGGLNIYKIQKP